MTRLTGMAIGALSMYFFDPERGRRRRAGARDRLVREINQFTKFFKAATCDLEHRVQGLVAKTSGYFGEAPTDSVLVDRVRSVAGKYVSNIRDIEVRAANGEVMLRGPIAGEEVQGLLWAVRCTHGVRGLVNELNPSADLHPAASRCMTSRSMSPSTRLLVGFGGAILMARGLSASAPRACVFGSLGAGLLACAMKNGQQAAGRAAAPQQHRQHREEPSFQI